MYHDRARIGIVATFAADPSRVHSMAASELEDLLEFCRVVGRCATAG